MTRNGTAYAPFPCASLARLRPVQPAAVLAAWVATQTKGQCRLEDCENALAPVFAVRDAVAKAEAAGLLFRDGAIIGARELSQKASASKSKPKGDPFRDLAAAALGYEASEACSAKRLARRDLAALALRQLFSLDGLPAWPTRQQARCALISGIFGALGGPFKEAVAKPLKVFRFDELSRRLYLAFVKLEGGTLMQADASLLASALGGPAETPQALTMSVLRAALGLKEAAQVTTDSSEPGLDAFAASIKSVARRLETKPYAGRVAIAQVYDAGVGQGLSLGTLDDFKQRLADAAREGFLDLERYDITGPFDATLKERSRLRLGRDERHFIVNQWI